MNNSAACTNRSTPLWRKVTGWIAVIVSTTFSGLWAFWGAIENFHEGWYFTSIWKNLLLMIMQYMTFMLSFIVLAIVGIRWPKTGGIITAIAGLFFIGFFKGSSALSLLVIPLLILAAFFFFGSPEPKKWAYRIAVLIPLLVYIGFSIEPAIRVMGRLDDGIRSARLIEGNGVKLMWAPIGPGWPTTGTSYQEAKKNCRFLTRDGSSLSDTPQNIWRLPTVNEVVRSMSRRGSNCDGVWDSVTENATFRITPEKETPLWNPTSQIIYWWTASDKNESTAYVAVYHGMIVTADKRFFPGSRAFRAVKELTE
jgi:hypothetical protein